MASPFISTFIKFKTAIRDFRESATKVSPTPIGKPCQILFTFHGIWKTWGPKENMGRTQKAWLLVSSIQITMWCPLVRNLHAKVSLRRVVRAIEMHTNSSNCNRSKPIALLNACAFLPGLPSTLHTTSDPPAYSTALTACWAEKTNLPLQPTWSPLGPFLPSFHPLCCTSNGFQHLKCLCTHTPQDLPLISSGMCWEFISVCPEHLAESLYWALGWWSKWAGRAKTRRPQSPEEIPGAGLGEKGGQQGEAEPDLLRLVL